LKCPNCGSEDVIKAGKLRNKYVTKQGYRCKVCKHFFVERDGFEGMTYPKEVITEVLHLYVEGLSLSKIREVIYQHHGFKPSDGSILNWTRKYAKLLEKLEKKLRPKLKGRVHLDEVEVKVGEKLAGA
jgi:transposase-like protein